MAVFRHVSRHCRPHLRRLKRFRGMTLVRRTQQYLCRDKIAKSAMFWDDTLVNSIISSATEVFLVERVEAAYQSGVAEAERDIAAGQPKLRYGARGAWGEDLARTLRAKFGVELVVLSCLTDAESSSFEAG